MASAKGLLRVGANSISWCIAIIGREVPRAGISLSFDHLVGAGEEGRRNFEAECLCNPEVDARNRRDLRGLSLDMFWRRVFILSPIAAPALARQPLTGPGSKTEYPIREGQSGDIQASSQAAAHRRQSPPESMGHSAGRS
jgi:hypothetical protein